jgi:hypothetical protein
MGINSGDLGGGIGSQTHHSTRNLVNQFESLEIKRFASSR